MTLSHTEAFYDGPLPRYLYQGCGKGTIAQLDGWNRVACTRRRENTLSDLRWHIARLRQDLSALQAVTHTHLLAMQRLLIETHRLIRSF